MGPEAVLSALPLNILKPVKGQPGRAWMFPLLRDSVRNTNLAHFKSEMVPLSEVMFQKVLDHGSSEKTMEVKIYETLVQQIWSTLPGYCDLPLDLLAAFDQTFAEMIANLLYKQTELRLDVCRAMKTLIESNQAIVSIEDSEEDLILQSRVTRETAQKNLQHLSQFASNMLAVLFNVYTETLPQSRGPILQTVNAFLSITSQEELKATFVRVSELTESHLANPSSSDTKEKPQKAKDQTASTAQTLMDLIIAMSAHVPLESLSYIFNISRLVIFRQDEPQLQKKAYKLIPRLAETEVGKAALRESHDTLQQLIIESAEKVSSPARRERLASIIALFPFIPDTSLHFIPTILSEVVICCKENNERAREAAYELLVQMGHRMASANGAVIENSKVPHMPDDTPAAVASVEEYFTMVSAGLAGSTPHMISASITAISRLLYEFRSSLSEQTLADMVQTMDLFLTSNNREIVKSCLGFVKVCVIALPVELMLPRLSTLIPNLIIWSHEHKGHFKAKVKHIIERMIRKYSYENVHAHCPETDRKLIINIRKTKERAKKRNGATKAGNDDDSENEANARPKRQFENEYDQALYSSESENSDASSDEGARASKTKTRKAKGGQAYILEDDDEPLDLLDKKALAKISSTKPVKIRNPTRTKAKVDLDGKLILGGAPEPAPGSGGAMDVDTPDGAGESSGVGAYVAALKGKDVAKRGRGGKLKFSNKRGRENGDGDGDGDDNMEATTIVDNNAVAIKNKVNPGRDRRNSIRGGRGRGSQRGGRSGKGGIAAGRRGLGVEKRYGGPSVSAGVGKARRGRN